jgi:ribosomal protein S18 acetylase RimI-like enzyme
MDETRIEPLTVNHERGGFDCGQPPLNSFILQHASVNHERGVSRVYVAVRGPHQQVLGYYASSTGSFLRDHLPPDDQSGLPRYPLPTAHLGRLAVDLSCRGQRLGEFLLFHFLKTACDVAERIGVFAVDLFSKDDEAKRFYQKYGFIPLQDDTFHLYLPMATVRAMFAQAAASPRDASDQEGGRS